MIRAWPALVLVLASCALFEPEPPPKPIVIERLVQTPIQIPDACLAPLVLRERPKAVCPGEPDKVVDCKDPRGVMFTWDQVKILKTMLIDLQAWGAECQEAVKAQAPK